MLQKLLEKLTENSKPEILTVELPPVGAQVLLVPEGMKAEGVKSYLDQYRKKPERRKGTISALDIDSFASLTNRFKAENSAVFQRSSHSENNFTASLQAILNYNPEGPKNDDADNRDHKVEYHFPLSEELKTWLKANKQPFNAKEFAEFLEDNIADLVVAAPDKFETKFGDNGVPVFATPSKIMELSRGIEVRVDERVTQAFRVSDGSFNMQFTTENKDALGAPLKLPEWFCLGIRVFENGGFFQIPARLRFRVKDGQVAWFYELYRKRDVLTVAFDTACLSAANQTNLPLYNAVAE